MVTEPESKQARILRSALATFCARGFHRATMEDIAAGAGVGKGTLYLYFQSKQALLEEIFRIGLDAYSSGLEAIAAGSSPAARRLEDMAVFALDFARANRQFARLAQEGPVDMREEFKRWLRGLQGRILETVRRVVAEGVQGGEFRSLEPLLLAHVFLGGIHSLVAAIIWGDACRQPRQTARDLMDLLLGGGGARPGDQADPLAATPDGERQAQG